MRSFAVVAGFAAVALAAPQYEAAPPAPASTSTPAAGYPSTPESSAPAYPAASSAPAYPVASSAPAYPAASSAPAYPAESSAPAYPAASSSAPAYAASSSAPAYAVSSSAPAYTTTEVISATTYECPEPTTITYGPSTYVITSSTVLSIPHYTATYVHTPVHTPDVPAPSASKPAYTTTEVVSATTYECPEPTTITYGPSTYVITSSTVLSIPHYTATYVHTPVYTPVVPAPSATKPAYTPAVPEASVTKPAYSAPPAPMYPSANGTVPVVPVGTATNVPSTTKPVNPPPQFTGAAGKATVGFFAVAGAVAAFL